MAGASGELPSVETGVGYGHGSRPAGLIIPRFRNITESDSRFVRGYHLTCGARRPGWQRAFGKTGLGTKLKARLEDMGPWMFYCGGSGETLPYQDNHVKLHPELKDAWGMPVLHFDVAYRDNESQMADDMVSTAAEILDAVGVKKVTTFRRFETPGLRIHEMGGARMGRDPNTSVLNAFNQSHDIANLFVTDGACMTSAGNQHPSLTYMALTVRAHMRCAC